MKIKPYDRLTLNDLEGLKNCNELDILYKIIDIANSARKRTEEILADNKQAGVDVRKSLQDIKILSDVMRDKIQLRKSKSEAGKNRLYKAIDNEKERIKKEDEKIKRLEKNRLEKSKVN
jgi:hypothetical protein